MESLQEVNKELHLTISTESLKVSSANEVSLYKDDLIDKEFLKAVLDKLALCYPKMQPGFFLVLGEYLMKEQFTKQRLTHAIDELIKTNVYPEIVPGAILGYDKRIKLKTYPEIVAEGNKNYPSEPGKMFQFYKKFKFITDKETRVVKYLYVSIADVEMYHIETLE